MAHGVHECDGLRTDLSVVVPDNEYLVKNMTPMQPVSQSIPKPISLVPPQLCSVTYTNL